MAKIVRLGRKAPVTQPWYLTRELKCPQCGAVFLLEELDFDGGRDFPNWEITMTERTPNGKQTIAGKCPDCKESISITQKMGGLT